MRVGAHHPQDGGDGADPSTHQAPSFWEGVITQETTEQVVTDGYKILPPYDDLTGAI